MRKRYYNGRTVAVAVELYERCWVTGEKEQGKLYGATANRFSVESDDPNQSATMQPTRQGVRRIPGKTNKANKKETDPDADGTEGGTTAQQGIPPEKGAQTTPKQSLAQVHLQRDKEVIKTTTVRRREWTSSTALCRKFRTSPSHTHKSRESPLVTGACLSWWLFTARPTQRTATDIAINGDTKRWTEGPLRGIPSRRQNSRRVYLKSTCVPAAARAYGTCLYTCAAQLWRI